MRDFDIAREGYKYKPRKKLSKKVLRIIYVLIFILFLVAISTKNKLMLFFFVTSFATIINYITNIQTIRYNPNPEVFFSLLLTRAIGFQYTLFMLFIPTLFVDIYTARMDKDTFISFVFTVLINYVMSGSNMNFVVLGIILVSAKFVIGLIINVLINISPQEIFFEHVLGFVTNIIVFLSFGAVILNLFR